MSSGEPGWKGEGAVTSSKEEPKRPAQIPAPKDVLLLFWFHVSAFCSLMELARPICGILERCLPSSLLSPTPLHYGLILRVGLHALCLRQEDHFYELIGLNIPSDSWYLGSSESY